MPRNSPRENRRGVKREHKPGRAKIPKDLRKRIDVLKRDKQVINRHISRVKSLLDAEVRKPAERRDPEFIRRREIELERLQHALARNKEQLRLIGRNVGTKEALRREKVAADRREFAARRDAALVAKTARKKIARLEGNLRGYQEAVSALRRARDDLFNRLRAAGGRNADLERKIERLNVEIGAREEALTKTKRELMELRQRMKKGGRKAAQVIAVERERSRTARKAAEEHRQRVAQIEGGRNQLSEELRDLRRQLTRARQEGNNREIQELRDRISRVEGQLAATGVLGGAGSEGSAAATATAGGGGLAPEVIESLRQGGVSEELIRRLLEARGSPGEDPIAQRIRAAKEAGLTGEALEKAVMAALGKEEREKEKKSGAAKFREGATEIAGGLSASIFNPAIYGNILLIVILVLMMWIVIQFFGMV